MLSCYDIDRVLSKSIADEIYLESSSSNTSVFDAVDRIISAIKELINKMTADGKKFMLDIKMIIQRVGLRANLQMLKMDLKHGKKKGRTIVQMVDVPKFINYYNQNSWKLEKKIIKPTDSTYFKSPEAYQRAIDSLERELDDFKSKLDFLRNHPIDVPIDKAISYVEKEISGESQIWKSYNKMLYDLEAYAIKLERAQKSQRNKSADYLTAHQVGPVKRLIGKFVQICRNAVSKFITGIVFFFA